MTYKCGRCNRKGHNSRTCKNLKSKKRVLKRKPKQSRIIRDESSHLIMYFDNKYSPQVETEVAKLMPTPAEYGNQGSISKYMIWEWKGHPAIVCNAFENTRKQLLTIPIIKHLMQNGGGIFTGMLPSKKSCKGFED